MIWQINVEEYASRQIDRPCSMRAGQGSSNYRISSSSITVQESESNQKNGAMHINIGPNPCKRLFGNKWRDLYKVTLLNSTLAK